MPAGVGRPVPRGRVRRSLNHLRNRPSLLSAMAVALVTIALSLLLSWLPPTTAALVGWDLGVATYILLASRLMSRATVTSMRRRARALDPGKGGVLVGAVAATLAALAAIIAELVLTKGSAHAGWSAVLAAVTVLLSWTFLHLFFAQHYAHDYWLDDRPVAERCLDFPGNDAPEYLEFIYFSFTIGMTAQVSDVTTRGAGIRRLVTLHAGLSFLFNTAILALGVNLAAGLVG